jgi:ABC-type multidrug transport system ATPase subunit
VLQFYCRLRKLPASRIDSVLRSLDLEAVKQEPVRHFSGGMVQRLGVAVALLPDTPVLVLDEPAANLDPEGAAQLRELVRSMKRRGCTAVFSTHVLPDVELLADRAAILVDGKLVAVESLDALRSGIAQRSRLRVALRHPEKRLAEAAVAAGALEAEFDGTVLWATAKPADLLRIIHEIEVAGGMIEHFSTAEPSLEEIYLRYVNAPKAHPALADLVGLREAVPTAG